MTSTNFLKSLTITAAALGNKFGVPVYVGGQTACTDGRSIRLPDVEGRERQKFCVHGIIGARQTGASNEHEHQTQFS